MIDILFITFLVAVTAIIVVLTARYVSRRSAFGLLAGLCAWFIYAGLLGYLGVLKNSRPPGVIFIAVPIVVFLLLFIVRFSRRASFTSAFPLWLLLGAQCFRIVVELFLHELWINGIVPKMLTFEGANVDIYIGASAPFVAWLSTRKPFGLRLSFAWNVLGLLALANVVTRAVLTAPGPLNLIHAEVPNLMFGTSPFLFIPAFFVPLAVCLHVVAIRSTAGKIRRDAGR